MEWDTSPNAGFSAGEPWLAVAGGWQDRNVATQDGTGILAFYRRMLRFRRNFPALTVGSYQALDASDDCFVFTRDAGGRRLAIAINFGAETRHVDISGDVLLSTMLDREGFERHIDLRPHEGVIVQFPDN